MKDLHPELSHTKPNTEPVTMLNSVEFIHEQKLNERIYAEMPSTSAVTHQLKFVIYLKMSALFGFSKVSMNGENLTKINYFIKKTGLSILKHLLGFGK